MGFEAVIFDLDGTLLDTLEDIADSVNRTLVSHGFSSHPLEAYRYFVGEGVETMIARALPPGEQQKQEVVAKCVAAFREDYSLSWNRKTKPYSGVPEMLDELAKRRTKMAIFSNKSDDFTQLCVNELLPDWHFDFVIGLREGVPPKPSPVAALWIAEQFGVVPGKILYVGDTATDMKTAVSAGMFSAGALWGFRTREELETNGARVLLDQPQDVIALVDQDRL